MRIVIGEDSALFREGLASLLAVAGHEVVGRAANASDLLATVRETVPDLAIVDIRMPPDHTNDGARAARAIRVELPEIGVVLLSQHLETHHSVELVSQGGFGYLLKDRVLDVDTFIEALVRVADGGSALDPEVVSRLVGRPADDSPLTPREREVLSLMAEGLANAGIARRLWLTDRTVETHVTSIMSKLAWSPTPTRTVACWRCCGSSASVKEPQDNSHGWLHRAGRLGGSRTPSRESSNRPTVSARRRLSPLSSGACQLQEVISVLSTMRQPPSAGFPGGTRLVQPERAC